jgi:predicted nucleic acid-binding protein
MKPSVILDTSVVVKWFLTKEEKHVEEAHILLRTIEKKQIEAWAPAFLLVELANILLRKKALPSKMVDQVIQKMKSVGIQFIPFNSTASRSLIALCDTYQLTTYDGLYLLLATEKKCPLITLDDQLLKAKDVAISLVQWANEKK